ncbi:hypothetical protein [Telluribacter sp. SYSU D00476]|uniref:hypothetical protein n=1 Tax=Telluribacter sp. SYSU D00476 TaxID=2811430 RepID=UPI001FF2DFE0|nr:hypothetical protein [Telluribacter sp. SYSU D00476]
MKHRSLFLTLLYILSTGSLLLAQPTKTAPRPAPKTVELGLIAKVANGKVLLRWIPLSYSTWAQGIDKGYIIERTDARGTKVRLTEGPVLPNVEPIENYNDSTKQQDMTLVSVALYKDGVKDKMPAAQLRQSYDFFMMSSLLNYESSKVAGVGLEDSTAEPGQVYTYTVSLVGNPAQSAAIKVNTAEPTQYAPILNLNGKATQQTLDLTWDEKAYRSGFAFYVIERSDDGVNYKRLNQNPYMNSSPEATSIMGYRELIPRKDTLFHYRIRGVDYFTQPSEPSNVVKVMAIPALPLPTGLAGEMTQDKGLTVQWEFPKEMEKYIEKVRLSQSNFIDQFYDTAVDNLSPATRSATFRAKSRAVYVRVHYTDSQGVEVASAPRLVQLVDSIPPAPPVAVKGAISREGLLTLEWKANPEEDIMGYYVFAANDSLGTPTRITDSYITTHAYRDSVAVKNVANKKMYYYVLAIDKRYNHSELSEVAVVKRPDLVPPTKPNFTDYEVAEKRVALEWVNPTDDDILHTTLQRRKQGGEWTPLRRFSPKEALTAYVDTTVASHTLYEYDLVVEDQGGNTAGAYVPVVIQSAEELTRIRFTEVKAVYDEEKQQVVLTWKADQLEAIEEFVVMREYPGEELSTWQVVDASEGACVDDQLHKDAKHTYVIQARLKEGYLSPSSAKAEIQL